MRCKGVCYRFAAKKPLGGFRFAAGQRPCSVCGIFVDSLSLGVRCPCCNNKLRLNSRNAKSRKNRFTLHRLQILEKTSNLIKSIDSTIAEPDQVITAKLVLNK
ncbi:conserved protein of unknown function [Nitrosotalea devaniterrae]|uniref:Uncharacterized protein n=1 Tax=Nitrosotalea devaniterrae TaxID=1078905 RepID=A0A128A441_9ARCH|nr:conserved protein of unknown function [Candidatus Nitrosotalea devanaterra]